jgi:hypothetical protein
MKKGKKIKPVAAVEYRLLITPKIKEREKRKVILLALRTTKEFSSFRYEIIVEDLIEGNTIYLKIHGLKAPQVGLPATGPAVYRAEYPRLRGQYSLVVTKLDREENAFTIVITDTSITVKESPEKKFVEIITREEDW